MILVLIAEKPKAYVPPALRGQQEMNSKPRYREAYEAASNLKQQEQDTGEQRCYKIFLIPTQYLNVGFHNCLYLNLGYISKFSQHVQSCFEKQEEKGGQGKSKASRTGIYNISALPFDVI